MRHRPLCCSACSPTSAIRCYQRRRNDLAQRWRQGVQTEDEKPYEKKVEHGVTLATLCGGWVHVARRMVAIRWKKGVVGGG